MTDVVILHWSWCYFAAEHTCAPLKWAYYHKQSTDSKLRKVSMSFFKEVEQS